MQICQSELAPMYINSDNLGHLGHCKSGYSRETETTRKDIYLHSKHASDVTNSHEVHHMLPK